MSRPTSIPSPADRARAREVEARLAELGFAPRARGFRLAGEAAGEPWSAARLAAALPGLGPVFAAFGRYLGSRADLLPVADCLVLAAIPDRGPAADLPEVTARIAAELGAPPLERFLAFEEAPFAVRLFHQAHRAWVAGGDAVVVRIAAPEMEEAIARDMPLLPLLARALPVGFPLAEAGEDFRHALSDETDFTLTAEALEEIAREPAEPGLSPDAAGRPEAPRVERRLTTSRVLTVAALAGTPVPDPAPDSPGEEAAAYDLAQRLVRFWLRQALLGRKLPLTADLARTGEGGLALLFGTFAGTHGGAQANLLEYLRAAATDDPEQVFACLVREVVPSPQATPAVPRGDLRKRLCQVVPLHHEELGAGGAGLAEHLLAHWRVLRQCGYRPELHLESFYRGLLWVTHAARRLAPVGDPLRDPLRDALEELQWAAGLSQLRRLADPRQLGEAFEGYLATLAVLPQQMEQAIALLGRPETPRPEGIGQRRRSDRSRGSGAAALALGLVMAGLALVVHRLTPLPGLPGAAIERAGALLFLTLGTLYLWRAGGRRS
jgi:hypothetical protein